MLGWTHLVWRALIRSHAYLSLLIGYSRATLEDITASIADWSTPAFGSNMTICNIVILVGRLGQLAPAGTLGGSNSFVREYQRVNLGLLSVMLFCNRDTHCRHSVNEQWMPLPQPRQGPSIFSDLKMAGTTDTKSMPAFLGHQTNVERVLHRVETPLLASDLG